MAETAAERAIRLASEQAPFTNFVDFTSNLVREIFRTLVDTTREQIETYVDMFEQISGGHAGFIAKNVGDLDVAALRYLNEVVRPTYTTEASDITMSGTTTLTFNPATVTLKTAELPALTESFGGIAVEIGDADNPQVPDDFSQAIVPASTSGGDPTISVAHLHAFAKALIERTARRSFDELQALLRIGLARVVPNKGFIETAMTYSIETRETSETSSTTTTTTSAEQSRGFNVGGFTATRGSVATELFRSAINRKLAGRYSNARSSSTLRVNVVNEKSTAATNLDIDITGRVRIDFITDYFPLLPPAPAVAAGS